MKSPLTLNILVVFSAIGLFFWSGCSRVESPAPKVISEAICDNFFNQLPEGSLREATRLVYVRRYRSAIEQFQQLVLNPTSQTPAQEIYTLNQLVYCAIKIKDFDLAEKGIVQLEKHLANDCFSEADKADYAFNKATLLLSRNEGKAALPFLQTAENFYCRHYPDAHLKKLEIYTALGQYYYFYSDQPDVIDLVFEYLHRANLEIVAAPELVAFGATHYFWKSFVSFMQRTPEAGILAADLAIQLIREAPEFIDTSLWAKCLSSKGVLYKSFETSSSFDIRSKAASLSQKSIELAKATLKDTSTLQWVYQDWLTYLTRAPDSIFFFDQLNKVRELCAGNVQIAQPNRLEALWHFRKKNYGKSIDLYKKCIAGLDQGKIVFNRKKIYDEAFFLIGYMYSERSKIDSAIFYEVKNILHGSPLYNQEKFEWEDLLRPEVQNQRLHAFVEYGHLASTYALAFRKDPGQLEMLHKSRRLFLITDSLVFNYALMTNLDASLNFLAQIVSAHYGNAVWVLYELYNQTHDPVYLEEANFFMERMKAFASNKYFLRDNYSADGYPETLRRELEKEAKLDNDLKAAKWALLRANSPDEKRARRVQIHRILTEQQTHQALLEKTYPTYFRRKMNRNFKPVTALKSVIAPETVVQYCMTPTHIFSLIARPDTILFFRQEKSAQLDQWIYDYSTMLTAFGAGFEKPFFQKFCKTSFELYNALVKPLTPYIPEGTKVVIIPDEHLAQLPFETFIRRLPQTEIIDYRTLDYWLKSQVISYSPSLKTWLFHKKAPLIVPKSPKICAFAYSASDSKSHNTPKKNEQVLPELPGAAREVKYIQSLYPGENQQYFFGNQCTKEQFFQSLGSPLDILHLALHANADTENPLNNRLYFRKSSPRNPIPDTLFMHEISPGSLQIPLAILSACSTSKGKVYSAEGTFSLMRSFMEHGARAVLSTFWNVDDTATGQIISHFYQNLQGSPDIPESLQKAKSQYLANADQYLAFPGFWAAIACWE